MPGEAKLPQLESIASSVMLSGTSRSRSAVVATFTTHTVDLGAAPNIPFASEDRARVQAPRFARSQRFIETASASPATSQERLIIPYVPISDVIRFGGLGTAPAQVAVPPTPLTYTQSMTAPMVQPALSTLLLSLVADGVFLPNPEVAVQDPQHARVDALMPAALHRSPKRREVRRMFDALYTDVGLFVDLRLQPDGD